MEAIDLAAVQAAAAQLAGVANRTPVHTSRMLNALSGRELFFKCENFQRSGSFKFRGAYNRLSRLSPAERTRGVVAFSSGNHAQGVALAAQLLGIPALIVMPDDAPPVKVSATRAYGAEIVFHNRLTEDREEVARRIVAKRGAILVPPFNDSLIMAGQGTLALELLADVPDLDALVIPVGGGGLIGGCAVAAKGVRPAIAVYGVEAEGADDVYQSVQSGAIVRIAPPATIADGIRTQAPGTLTFPLIQRYVAAMTLVSDAEIIAALQLIVTRMKLVIEPTAAVGVAAVLNNRIPPSARRVGIILCGGNVDPALLGSLLQEPIQPPTG